MQACLVILGLLSVLMLQSNVPISATMEAERDYTPMENILTRIHGQFIRLNETDKQRNNVILGQVIGQIIEKMCNKSPLFANMYREKFYGGSYYDDLKVSQPNEYDLDCLLYLPKDAGPVIIPSDQPAYVYVKLEQMHKFNEKKENLVRFPRLERLLDANNYLQTNKVLSWMESVINLALNEFDSMIVGNRPMHVIPFVHGGVDEALYVSLRKCGPALTLNIIGEIDEIPLNIDVDLVTCFKFFDDQWPRTAAYTSNPSRKFNTFFVVPKPHESPRYWRLSFQEQERELLRQDYKTLKPTIRLLKKIRDNYNHNIASYYIKTIFLRELKYGDKQVWTGKLSNTFMFMLEKYADYLQKCKIPYYWNEEYNLIEKVKPVTCQDIANFLRRMIADINRNYKTNPYVILNYLAPDQDVIIDGSAPITFKPRLSRVDSGIEVESNIEPKNSSWCSII